MTRLAPVLAPGRQLVIVDALPSPGSENDPAFVAYALSLGLRTGPRKAACRRASAPLAAAAGLGSVERMESGTPGSMVAALCASRDA